MRFRPRMDREVEVFRHLTKRDLEENPNFSKDVEDCLFNILTVPKIRRKMKNTFKELENVLRAFQEKRSAKSAS